MPGVLSKEDVSVRVRDYTDHAEIHIRSATYGESKVQLSRTIKVYKDSSKNTVSHEMLYLKKQYQGNGVAKELFKNSLKLYDKIRVNSISVWAADIGTYTWGRYGFNAQKSSETLKKFKTDLNSILGFEKFGKSDNMKEISSLKISPKDITKLDFGTKKIEKQIEDVTQKIRGKGLGKELNQLNYEKRLLQKKREEMYSLRKMIHLKDEKYFDSKGNFQLGKAYLIDADRQWGGKIKLSQNSPDRVYLDTVLNSREQ